MKNRFRFKGIEIKTVEALPENPPAGEYVTYLGVQKSGNKLLFVWNGSNWSCVSSIFYDNDLFMELIDKTKTGEGVLYSIKKDRINDIEASGCSYKNLYHSDILTATYSVTGECGKYDASIICGFLEGKKDQYVCVNGAGGNVQLLSSSIDFCEETNNYKYALVFDIGNLFFGSESVELDSSVKVEIGFN